MPLSHESEIIFIYARQDREDADSIINRFERELEQKTRRWSSDFFLKQDPSYFHRKIHEIDLLILLWASYSNSEWEELGKAYQLMQDIALKAGDKKKLICCVIGDDFDRAIKEIPKKLQNYNFINLTRSDKFDYEFKLLLEVAEDILPPRPVTGIAIDEEPPGIGTSRFILNYLIPLLIIILIISIIVSLWSVIYAGIESALNEVSAVRILIAGGVFCSVGLIFSISRTILEFLVIKRILKSDLLRGNNSNDIPVKG